MVAAQEVRVISDSRRDAQRYHNLLLALERATDEIARMEDQGRPRIDEVLARLLPALADALSAGDAFVAIQRRDDQTEWFDVIASYPRPELRGSHLPASRVFRGVVADGKPRVVAPFENEAGRVIAGLEAFGAVSAILVRVRAAGGTRVVGICHQGIPVLGPYLAEDGRALNSVIELVAIGARIGERQNAHWQALHEASKAISGGFTAEHKQVLDQIVEQAVERISRIEGPRPVSGIIQLYDEATQQLRFESVYPPDLLQPFKTSIGEQRSIDPQLAANGRIGVTGRAVLLRRPVRVQDVRSDPDYVRINAETRAELAVPLLDGEQVIGVLSLESSEPSAFNEDDEAALAGLAELAVIAIKNASQADHLSRANAVAMMGAWGADFAHAVNNEVGFIRRAACAVEQSRSLDQETKRLLSDIDRHAANLSMLELPQLPAPWGQAQAIRDAALLDETVLSEVESFQRDYPAITWQSSLACPGVRVAIHEQWLRRLLHLLMHNAAEAIPRGKATRTVMLRTILQQRMAEVQIEDSGQGIPPAMQPLLFHQPIAQADRRRGQGLLLARFLAEQHGGSVALNWTHPGKGTSFAFSIPIVRRQRKAPETDSRM